MITEIVSNGMLSLPAALAVVGIVPAVILVKSRLYYRSLSGHICAFTAKLLIDFKLNHPNVHTMGDAGYILGGPIAREILSLGTVIFAICGTLRASFRPIGPPNPSNNGLCGIAFLGIFSAATFIFALPRTLDKLRWAGINPVPGRVLNATLSTNFYQAFLAITNPITFRFFILISEMKQPQDAMKVRRYLGGMVSSSFATLFYIILRCCVSCQFLLQMDPCYVFIGNTVASPALLSLSPKWLKQHGLSLCPIFYCIVGGLYAHTAAKLVFVRIFRHSKHLYSHTLTGWAIWTLLCFTAVGLAFLFVVAIPVFAYLIGIVAALFASWYTYGVAGFFWIHDTAILKGGRQGLLRRPMMLILGGVRVGVSGRFTRRVSALVNYERGRT
ncbi:hypothetical protein BJ912DRAFT_946633 [Pholiota molesta]|nr:hypothetical protein BJ912DRAFT_946633 [Pholiota molesta]